MQIRSGSIHYHRTHPAYWKDRLQRMAAMGLNAVQTYVPWNFHEIQNGVWNFTGPRDLGAFLQAANDTGLIVLLRAGPYICGMPHARL
jgi:beta-galactosidase GanA